MIELPLWRECRQCTRFIKTPETPGCSDPFPPSGICPHLNEREFTVPHKHQNFPQQSHKYAALLDEDIRMASIFLRWRHGKLLNDSDYLHIRSAFFDPRYLMKGDSPLDFLQDILNDSFLKIARDFCLYHLRLGAPGSPEYLSGEFPPEISAKVCQVLRGGIGYILMYTEPEIIKANAKLGSDWSRMMIDIIHLLLWHHLECKHVDFSKTSDTQFRRLFEEEWKTLRKHGDCFYGFTVFLRITNQDMVRYQNLPRGDANVRREISAYLSHRATEYPFWINLFTNKFREVAFEKPLRECYQPLVNSLTHKAVTNLTSGDHGATVNQGISNLKADVEQAIKTQLWEKYDEYRAEFNFYWNHPDKERPLGKIGFVALQDEETKRHLDRLFEEMGHPIRTKHFTEISFAHYINVKLTNWLEDTYPADAPAETAISLNAINGEHSPLLERISSDSAWNADDTSLPLPNKVITGIDNIDYITINALAERSGMNVHQLRRLDKQGLLPFTRVKNVCAKPWALNPDVRLYPLTAEATQTLQLAKVRIEKHSSQLEGNELDRKTVADILGMSVGALRKWEDKGLVSPQRKGRIVVYDDTALEQAKRIKEHKDSK